MTDNVKKDITQLRISGMGYGRISRQLGIVRLSLIASEIMYRARHGGRYACSVDMRLNLGRPVRERDFALTVAG